MRTRSAIKYGGRTLVVLAILARVHDASAWDSLCWNVGQETSSTDPFMDPNFCRADKPSQCREGIASTRGRMLSEHTFITRLAMIQAGLQDYTVDSAFPAYWSVSDPAVDGSGGTYEPASAARAQVWVAPGASDQVVYRYMTIPELAQLPDHSYSLSDLLLGNEKCLPGNSPCRLSNQIDGQSLSATHNFKPHMGAVNSTHFGEQAHATYQLYHQIATLVAERCLAMRDAITDSDFVKDLKKQHFVVQKHPLEDEVIGQATPPAGGPLGPSDVVNEVRTCEREALVFEAIGSHFLADAWSSGHMWGRWGSPLFAGTEYGRSFAIASAMVAGMLHGARGAFDEYDVAICSSLPLEGSPLVYQTIPQNCSWGVLNLMNDQMCMPGPFYMPAPYPVLQNESWLSQTSTEFRYPDGRNPFGNVLFNTDTEGTNSLFAAAGDLYLLPCRSLGHRAVLDSDNPYLKAQRSKMLDCAARGFAEVYNAGPRTGTAGAPVPYSAGLSAAEDPLCWSQLVTNQSISLGWGFTGRRPLARVILGDPLADNLETLVNAVGTDVGTTQLEQLAHIVAARDPSGVQLAVSGLVPEGEHFLFQISNVKGAEIVRAYDDGIDRNGVDYYDGRYPEKWQSYFEGPVSCATDRDCSAGSYCATGFTGSHFCQPQETAIMSVYRHGETPAWCTTDSKAALEAAAVACHSSVETSVACNACVDAVLPHLRNACDDKTFLPASHQLSWDPIINDSDKTLFQLRSLCDVYDGQGITPGAVSPPRQIMPVYRLYDPANAASARSAALDFCKEGRKIYFADPHDSGVIKLNLQPGTAAAQDTHLYGPTEAWSFDDVETAYGCVVFNVCGTTTDPGYLNYVDEATDPRPTHVHTFKVHAAPIFEPDGKKHLAKLTPYQERELDFRAFQGPDCNVPAAHVTQRADGDDLALDWTVTKGQHDSICIRLKQNSYTVWSSSITSENGATCW